MIRGILAAKVLLLGLATLAFANAQTQKREEVLQYWTEERLAAAKERDIVVDPDTGDMYDIEYVGDSGLYKLVLAKVAPRTPAVPVPVESPSAGRQRNLEDGLPPSAPKDGETFFNPRTVTFKAPVVSAGLSDTGISYSFVFEHDSTEALVTVAADEIDNTGIAKELVGGFTDGTWTWRLEGIDAQSKVVDASVRRKFTISGSGLGERRLQSNVANASWESGGQVQNTVGKLFFTNTFSMKKGVFTADSACTGTLIKDKNTDTSIILTTAHCVYSQELEGSFSWNVIFIPDYENSESAKSIDCAGDPCGCWTPSGAVVLQQYADVAFPQNLKYDYALFIVNDVGDHGGTTCEGTEADQEYALDEAINATVFGNIGTDYFGDFIYSLGYPGMSERDLRYCAQPATPTSFNFDPTITYGFLRGCDLAAGSSGAGWFQNMNEATGQGVVVAVNSFSISNRGTVSAFYVHTSSLTGCQSPS